MIPISDSIPSLKFPIANILLIAANIIVFFFEITSPIPDAFIQKYALIPSLINFSHPDTLYPFVAAMFLHAGFLHIIANMLFLWVFGDNIEGYFGILFFLFIYFISGITGNLTQFILMSNSNIPMLGASGAIAGIIGSYFILFPHAKIRTLIPVFGFFSIVQIPAPIMLGYWFLLQVISGTVSLTLSGDSGGTAFFAHVGGFATGLILTLLLRPFVKHTQI